MQVSRRAYHPAVTGYNGFQPQWTLATPLLDFRGAVCAWSAFLDEEVPTTGFNGHLLELGGIDSKELDVTRCRS